MTRVLIAGVPRSGTTWVAKVLAAGEEVDLVSEPDNHRQSPFAFRAKRKLPGRFHPLLGPEDEAGDYERLWTEAFGLGDGQHNGLSARERVQERGATRLLRAADRSSGRSRKAFMRRMGPGTLPPRLALAELLAVPRGAPHPEAHLVVKSVYASLAIEWIADRFPVTVIVVLRNPYNVLSSWRERGWLGEPGDDMLDEVDAEAREALSRSAGLSIPAAGTVSPLTRAAYFYALLTNRLLDAARRHPDWSVVWHEALAQRPHQRFRDLALASGLPWADASDRAIETMNRPGAGYETHRVAAQLEDVWRRRLSREQARDIDDVLEQARFEPRNDVVPAGVRR